MSAPANAGSWRDWSAVEADNVRARGQWRAPVDFDADGPEGKLADDGHAVVSFASNDYLGLTQHPAVLAAAHAAVDRWGTGAGAARLIVGSRPVHTELERELADWKHAERAVLFSTGFAANLGVLTTFAGPDVLVCSDELNHASIIDGRKLSGAQLEVYRHADAAHVDELLAASTATRAVVVSESVFSMDGDVAPVDDLVDVCARHGALLVLDEAHAVLGPDLASVAGIAARHGAGIAAQHGAGIAVRHGAGDVLRVGTLSKTLGALGGYVAGPAVFTDLLVNRARSYIFTTASTPADAAAALAALGVVRSGEGDELRARLRRHVERLRPGHPSPIIPYVCGDEQAALDAAAALLDEGLLVTAIRPPTVPPGTSRLRVTVSATHTDDQVERLARALTTHFP
ncbi:MAG TPA: 8-amino-7-oxononanoate synthase [Acidimicrobiia bacterium]|nr:8-amino-7-oxononanoate synthase [Acidimicrobiia bacterium]